MCFISKVNNSYLLLKLTFIICALTEVLPLSIGDHMHLSVTVDLRRPSHARQRYGYFTAGRSYVLRENWHGHLQQHGPTP